MDRNPPQVPVEVIASALLKLYGLDGALTELDSERDQNTRVVTDEGSYLFKVCNADEDPEVIDLQIKALRHIAARDEHLPVPRALPTLSGEDTGLIHDQEGTPYIVRLMSFVAGDTIRSHPELDTPALRRSSGEMLARLDLALRGFFHPAADQEHPWTMTQVPKLLEYTHSISDNVARRNVEMIIAKVRDEVLPRTAHMRHQVVHQDAHTGNLVIDPSRPTDIAGIIDFGDMVYAPLIMDLAVATDLTGRPSLSPEGMFDVAVGYDSVLPLEEAEVDVLVDLILGRMAMTATIVAARNALWPLVPAYHDHEVQLWSQIETLLASAPDMRIGLRRATRFPMPIDGTLDTAKLRADRERVMGEKSPHFYKETLHLERGKGVWLYGSNGDKYLDFYNNVPTVGHAHPHVVNAVSRQLAALNTHTRYLYNNSVEYADRLTSTLGDHLDVCLFVNSGSEANDVAWQISQVVTGNAGLLVMHNAYHGITQAGIDMTTAKGLDRATHVEEIPAPDDYRRGVTKAEVATRDANAAVERLAARGMKPAAFIVDSAMCSSGIPDVPDDFLPAVARAVQVAGGLIIADEVQSGFGRLGAMWGHELLGMRPDIVTLGKPVGNGHPLGVVITSRAILDEFQAQVRLFSTFGGNPVSCAAGLAVLDVIEREDLVENSQAMGRYLQEQLWKLAETQPLIGDVRGRGLLAGLELVTDRTTKEPATATTLKLLEVMRENGALVGKDGEHAHILKLRPPLVTTATDIDLFIGMLDRSLTTVSS
ncbi:MAG: aminotransferase class III-fold pyridoxal phosphate-dependent enzyme [Acidimicrobiia bacterium]|nr:aminotransferase class III-fold pyridoxal phosphate-dependent enzyme [Acidimicrobiia bacterium]MDH5504709.1 aminotransferase class III-fold pyridoxal phosphate-dependent enzyme [Acidimicrobiia bacterium]